MPKLYRVYHNGKEIANVRDAGSFWRRFRGLMGVRELKVGEGILLHPCSSIHMFFMSIPIDVIALKQSDNESYETTEVLQNVHPWQWIRPFSHTSHVLELAAGTAIGIKQGDMMYIRDIYQNPPRGLPPL